MDMNNTFGPLLVGMVFGTSISVTSKLSEIIELLKVIAGVS